MTTMRCQGQSSADLSQNSYPTLLPENTISLEKNVIFGDEFYKWEGKRNQPRRTGPIQVPPVPDRDRRLLSHLHQLIMMKFLKKAWILLNGGEMKRALKMVSLILIILLIQCTSADAATGRVITIDGIDPVATITGSISGNSGTGYVFDAIGPDIAKEITDKIGVIQPFYWANDALYTDAAVQSLTDFLRAAYIQVKSTNAPLVIVSHSWGTVLAYAVLEQNPDIIVDKLITMGSPLNANGSIVGNLIGGFTSAKLFEQGIVNINDLPNIRLWYNYWTDCDAISANIPAVGGLNIDTAYSSDSVGACHSSYYSTYPTWGGILTRVLDTLPPLAISYSAITSTAPSDITFNAIGSLASDSGTSYTWDFGDTQTGNGKSVTHYYRQPNNYNVTLTMTDNTGSPHVVTKAVTVLPPEVNVTYPNGFENLYRHFETPSNSAYKSYVWNFGDGVVRTDDNDTTSHTYATSGYFTVKLTITLQDDTTITSEQGIFVGPGTRYIQGHTIYGEERWYSGGIYEIQGSISVAQGATLTIEPGVTVKHTNGGLITVNGTLNADGVKFTWADGQNEWNGIQFYGNTANGSRLENSVIEHAQGTHLVSDEAYNTAAVYILNSSPLISNLEIKDSTAQSGLYIRKWGTATAVSPTITNTTIRGFSSNRYGLNVKDGASPSVNGSIFSGNGYGIHIDSSSGGTYQGNTISGNSYGAYVYYSSNNPVLSGNTYTGNTTADVYAAGTITGTAVWDGAQNGTYRVGSLSINPGASLNIATGNTVTFDSGGQLAVNGTLKANGVTFTWADGQNEWNGIQFYGNTANGSRLENSVIEHAQGTHLVSDEAYNTAAVYILNSSPLISNLEIKDSTAQSGLYIRKWGTATAVSPTITNTTIRGFSSNRYGLNVKDGASPSVNGSIFSGNGYGIHIDSSSGGTYQGNTISGNSYGAYVFYSLNNPVLSGNTYTGNTTADIYAAGTITGTAVWDGAQNGTYRVGSLSINPGASLNIATGNTVTFDSGGQLAANGTLKANGVTFTWADGQNEWNGIQFYGNTANGSRLENSVIEHAQGTHLVSDEAYNTAAVYILNSSPLISNLEIKDSTAQSGLYIRKWGTATAVSPTITNTTIRGFSSNRYGLNVKDGASPSVNGSIFSGNGYGIHIDSSSGGTYQGNTISGNSYGAYVYYSSNNPVLSGNTYTGNTTADVYAAGTITGTAVWDGAQNGTYRVGSLSINPGASLNIATGNTVTFDSGGQLAVNGTLKANGVTFTWADGQNEWNGIRFFGDTANNSELGNCVIEHAKGTYAWSDESYNTAAVYIGNSSPSISTCEITNSTALSGISIRKWGTATAVSPTITNTTIRGFNNNRYGLRLQSGASPSVNGSIFSGNGYGIYIDSSSGGTYQDNSFFGNGLYGLYYSGNILLSATNNNWGDPSGPLDDSDDRAAGGWYNPNGKGNKVSNRVNYYPWTGTSLSQPSPPTGLYATPGNVMATIKWNNVGNPELGGYKIYYGTASGSYAAPLIVGSISSYKLTGLINGTTYYFAVSAMNSVGVESAKSAEMTAKPIYDITAPAISTFTAIASLELPAVAISLFATDNVGGTGVAEYCVQETGSHTTCIWSSTVPTQFTLSATGDKTLYAWARDGAGNVSAPLSVPVTIIPSDKPGDFDGNGTVTISEMQNAINMFLGLKDVSSYADLDKDGIVSISEVKTTMDSFLGL